MGDDATDLSTRQPGTDLFPKMADQVHGPPGAAPNPDSSRWNVVSDPWPVSSFLTRWRRTYRTVRPDPHAPRQTMKDEQTDRDEDEIEFSNAPEDIIWIDDSNSFVPEMTDAFREMVRKALTKKRPPDTPPAPSA